jgi:hypothetical protein
MGHHDFYPEPDSHSPYPDLGFRLIGLIQPPESSDDPGDAECSLNPGLVQGNKVLKLGAKKLPEFQSDSTFRHPRFVSIPARNSV